MCLNQKPCVLNVFKPESMYSCCVKLRIHLVLSESMCSWCVKLEFVCSQRVHIRSHVFLMCQIRIHVISMCSNHYKCLPEFLSSNQYPCVLNEFTSVSLCSQYVQIRSHVAKSLTSWNISNTLRDRQVKHTCIIKYLSYYCVCIMIKSKCTCCQNPCAFGLF